MPKPFVILLCLLCVGGCGLPTALIPIPIPDTAADLDPLLFDVDGMWTLSDGGGRQACLIIQESRVSILDTRCGIADNGLVARITEAPPVTGGGSVIVVTATYNFRTFEETQLRLTFSGQRQPDGTFTGVRRDEVLDDSGAFEETPALLQRTAFLQ